MNIAHITQRLAGCHMTGCATHQGKTCDCGAVEHPAMAWWRENEFSVQGRPYGEVLCRVWNAAVEAMQIEGEKT